jgi:hypothetical protein
VKLRRELQEDIKKIGVSWKIRKDNGFGRRDRHKR